MDSKEEQRLAELEESEERWREAVSVYKCRRCGGELGRIEWRDAEAGPSNKFKTPAPHMLRIRRAIPLGYASVYTDSQHPDYDDDDLTSAVPRVADIHDGVICHQCGTETRVEALAPDFHHAGELARLRRRKWYEQGACIRAVDHVPWS